MINNKIKREVSMKIKKERKENNGAGKKTSLFFNFFHHCFQQLFTNFGEE